MSGYKGKCRPGQLSIRAYVPEEVCPGNTVGLKRFCGVSIDFKDWNRTYVAEIYPPDSKEYEFGATVYVYFETTDLMPQNMWNGYQLPRVQVVLTYIQSLPI